MVTRQSRGAALRVEVLGPLRLVVDGTVAIVPGPRRRAVLAMLAMASGRSVSVDELLDAVRPDATPDSGRRTLHSHISRLRGHLGRHADRVERDGNGYRLHLEHDELDAAHVRSLATQARSLVDERPSDAIELFASALAQWRGVALEEFPDVAPLAADAVALASLRLDLVDEWLDTRLAHGRSTAFADEPDLAADATRALASSPLRERTACIVLRALAEQGRHADAMRVAHEFRTRLVDETGFDPSAAFVRLERAIAAGEIAVTTAATVATAAPVAPAAARPPPQADMAAQPAPTYAARTPFARPTGPLIGRADELAAAHRHLRSHVLVTVVGPGGVGKSRLALEVTADVADADARHVCVLELATIENPNHVDDALGATLGLNTSDRGRTRDAAVAVLNLAPTLLVVDNCEHVIDGARDLVADLLSRTPQLRVLATSREPLGLPAEHLLRLGPLPVPDRTGPLDNLDEVPAVAAFLAHARRRVHDFEINDETAAIVAEIVHRLDGLPLAVELAAGRVGTLGMSDLRDRLGRALDILGAGRASVDARHRTLRSTIDWSYRLLGADEQALLRAIALFPGGIDLDGIERVAAHLGLAGDPAATVARLVDASVVVADTSDTRTRFRLLETVRSFAADALDAHGSRAQAEDALVARAVELAAHVGELGRGPREADADRQLSIELPNLRAARDVALRHQRLDDRIAITLALNDFSLFRPLPELHAWAIELCHELPPSHPRFDEVTRAASRAAWLRGDLDGATQFAQRGTTAPEALGIVLLFRGELDKAVDLLLEAATNAEPAAAAVHVATAALGAVYARRFEDAEELVDRAAAAQYDSAAPSVRGYVHYTRAELLAHRDELDAAITEYLTAIELARHVGATFVVGIATVGLVSAYGRLGMLPEAFDGYRWLVDYWRRAGNWTQMWTTMRNLARALLDAGDPTCAAFVLAAADHAEGAASVDPRTAAEHDALNGRIAAMLGMPELERIRSRAVALPRTSVVHEALEAVDAALDSVRRETTAST
ncbi:MAG TPA: BTAD domain-containing putative transcriptional regulator [Acidimicrobiales bacterium]